MLFRYSSYSRAVHRAFRKGIVIDTVAMDNEVPSLRVQIKKAKREAGGYFQTLSVRAEKVSQQVGDEFLNQSLFPLSSTAETIDAACICEDVTVLFQMTVSPSHSSTSKASPNSSTNCWPLQRNGYVLSSSSLIMKHAASLTNVKLLSSLME